MRTHTSTSVRTSGGGYSESTSISMAASPSTVRQHATTFGGMRSAMDPWLCTLRKQASGTIGAITGRWSLKTPTTALEPGSILVWWRCRPSPQNTQRKTSTISTYLEVSKSTAMRRIDSLKTGNSKTVTALWVLSGICK